MIDGAIVQSSETNMFSKIFKIVSLLDNNLSGLLYIYVFMK